MKEQMLKEMIKEQEKLLQEFEESGAPAEALIMVEEGINNIKSILDKKKVSIERREFELELITETEEKGLIDGKVYKNFKVACIENGLISLDASAPKGNTKKKLEKELNTLCKWHKEGQKIIIDEVFEKMLIKEDKRRYKSIYVDSIKTILFYSLRDLKGELYLSVNKFIRVLELFNQYYYELESERDYLEVSLETGIDIYTLKGFKVGSRREAQRIIERALRSMKSQRILDYMQGRIIVTNDNNYRFATPEERRVIQRIEEEELKKLNCFNMASLKFKNLESKFYYRVKGRFKEENLEYIDYTFHGYFIVSHDKTISEQIELIEKESNVVELKGLFKKRLEEFALGSHAREVKKEFDSVGFGEPILEFNPIASSSYIPNFQKAIDTFIDI